MAQVVLPEEGRFLGLAALRDLFSDASSESVVVVTRLAVQGCAVPGLGMDQAVFTVVGKALQGAALFTEVEKLKISV